MIFNTRHEKKNHVKENELLDWKNMTRRNLKPPHIIEAMWAKYIQHVMFKYFVWWLWSSIEN